MKKAKMNLLLTMVMIGVIPLLIVGVVLSVVSINTTKEEVVEETFEKLKVAAEGLDEYYAWDIIHTGEAAYEHDYVDGLKADDIELTLFIGDERYITSLIDSSTGKRNEGTKADPSIYATVSAGNDYHAENVKIGGVKYFVYYTPVKDANNKVVGMAFAGTPQKDVDALINKVTTQAIMIAVILMLVSAAIVVLVAMKVRSGIVKIVNATNTLAEGKLYEPIEVKSGIKEIGVLIDAAKSLQMNLVSIISTVNNNVNQLNNNVGMITDGVTTCNEATSGIVSAVDELAKGSMDMAEAVQNTASAMQEIGDGIAVINELAGDANTAANDVMQISNEAKTNLSQLITANGETIQISDDVVNGINEASNAIEEIRKAADVIADIASQTNLLSLNASIEAARAGEAGRGFAVVASSIQNLASQSDESTKEIKQIIQNIVEKSENNVKLANMIKEAVDNEGKVLSDVSDSFDAVNSKIETTAEAIEEISAKATGLDSAKVQVLDEVSTLSSISEENAASCQETNASMEELGANVETINQQAIETKEVSDQLGEAVSYFKLQ